ncbi:Mor transcription activator family protein [compost metagenome]
MKLSRRDRQIYDDFNGSNQSALARKYGVSLQWVYKIIKAVRKEEIARRQGDMFGPASDA